MGALCVQTIDSVLCGDLRNGAFPRVYDALRTDFRSRSRGRSSGGSRVRLVATVTGLPTEESRLLELPATSASATPAPTSATATSTCQ